MLKNSSSKKTGITVSVSSAARSDRHYSVCSAVSQARSDSAIRSRPANDLKAKAVMFQNGQMSRREFIGEVSGLIMYAAKLMKCRSYDWRYDYYLYIISNIGKLISYYKPSDDFSFESWFISVCKKRYISFIRLKKSKWCCVSDAGLTEIFSDSASLNADDNLPSYSYEMLDYSGLSSLEQNVIKARYGIPADGSAAAAVQSEREEEKQRIADMIAKKYARLLDIRVKIQNAGEDEADELRSRERRIVRRKRSLENRYCGVKTLTSLSDISKMYNMSRYAVEKTLKSAENKLYMNNYYARRTYEA